MIDRYTKVLLTVIAVNMTIGTTAVLADYLEGCGWVEENARTRLYGKTADESPTYLYGIFCNSRTCVTVKDLLSNSIWAKNNVYWCGR